PLDTSRPIRLGPNPIAAACVIHAPTRTAGPLPVAAAVERAGGAADVLIVMDVLARDFLRLFERRRRCRMRNESAEHRERKQKPDVNTFHTSSISRCADSVCDPPRAARDRSQ